MNKKIEKVHNVWLWLLVFYLGDKSAFSLYTWQRTQALPLCLQYEKGLFIPFQERTAGEEHSRDSEPPLFPRTDELFSWFMQLGEGSKYDCAIGSSLFGNCLPAERVLGICGDSQRSSTVWGIVVLLSEIYIKRPIRPQVHYTFSSLDLSGKY